MTDHYIILSGRVEPWDTQESGPTVVDVAQTRAAGKQKFGCRAEALLFLRPIVRLCPSATAKLTSYMPALEASLCTTKFTEIFRVAH